MVSKMSRICLPCLATFVHWFPPRSSCLVNSFVVLMSLHTTPAQLSRKWATRLTWIHCWEAGALVCSTFCSLFLLGILLIPLVAATCFFPLFLLWPLCFLSPVLLSGLIKKRRTLVWALCSRAFMCMVVCTPLGLVLCHSLTVRRPSRFGFVKPAWRSPQPFCGSLMQSCRLRGSV